MKDALTIVVVHISRQQGQSLLHVGQEFRLKAGADFLQRVNEARHFVGPDPPVQGQSIEPGHLAPHPGKRIQGDLFTIHARSIEQARALVAAKVAGKTIVVGPVSLDGASQ